MTDYNRRTFGTHIAPGTLKRRITPCGIEFDMQCPC